MQWVIVMVASRSLHRPPPRGTGRFNADSYKALPSSCQNSAFTKPQRISTSHTYLPSQYDLAKSGC